MKQHKHLRNDIGNGKKFKSFFGKLLHDPNNKVADYNKHGECIFTTEIIAICNNEKQSEIVKKDEITFNANKSYNTTKN